MIRGLNSLNVAADVVVLHATAEVGNRGMGKIVRAKYMNRLLDKVRLVHIVHYKIVPARRQQSDLRTNRL